MEINKLLEERGKIHGDAEKTHSLAWNLYNLLEGSPNCHLSPASRGMLFLLMIKLVRGCFTPFHADHWDDICGYATLIKKAECKDPDHTTGVL